MERKRAGEQVERGSCLGHAARLDSEQGTLPDISGYARAPDRSRERGRHHFSGGLGRVKIQTDLLNTRKTRKGVQAALDAVDRYVAKRAATTVASPVAVDFVNASRATRCAEEDNVYVKVIGAGVASFSISAEHPPYVAAIREDSTAPDFTACDFSGDASFPFCSDRCRLIDLGKWASGGYVISTPITDPEMLENLAEENSQKKPPDDDASRKY